MTPDKTVWTAEEVYQMLEDLGYGKYGLRVKAGFEKFIPLSTHKEILEKLAERAKELAKEKLDLTSSIDWEYESSQEDADERKEDREKEYKKDIEYIDKLLDGGE